MLKEEKTASVSKKNDRDLISRKVYFFTCEKCGHTKRQSFRKSNANIGLCRVCRRNALLIHKDQGNLFANLINENTYEPSGSIS